MENALHLLAVVGSFVLVALAAQQIGYVFERLRLPRISGFLLTGVLAGPFLLDLLPPDTEIQLRFVDEISLAFIAFAAGNELQLSELRGRLKGIAWITAGNALVIPLAGTLAMLAAADHVPFMQAMSFPQRLAVSLLAGAILVARSPSSAIALVNELRAKGPFTQTVLGVTMITDVLVIVLFAVASSLADSVFTGIGFSLASTAVLLLELTLAFALGLLVAATLQLILSRQWHAHLKVVLILLLGLVVFRTSASIREYSHQFWSFELFIEPLLVCMVAGFAITNRSRYRTEFARLIETVAPWVYIAFFTLTGDTLAIDVLAQTWPIALGLFVVRLLAIFAGSFAGGTIAGDPPQFKRQSWLTFITQAGVGLGLAKEVAAAFDGWGTAFATTIIAVIVVSQLVGPPFFKFAVQRVGEAHTRGKPAESDGVRDALIFGLERQALALARQLESHGWRVRIASRRAKHLHDELGGVNLDIRPFSDISLSCLHGLEAGRTDAIIAMLPDTEENFRICELAFEAYGTPHIVALMNDRKYYPHFTRIGAHVVEPQSALVSLFDQMVRSPATASALLGTAPNQAFEEIELRDPALHGVALRDIRLPLDSLVLSIQRDGQVLVTHGYTQLQLGDRITVVGSPESIGNIQLLFSAPI